MVTVHRGITLYGQGIHQVFGPVDSAYYIQSILHDIENITEDIIKNPVYYTLNGCRVLLFLKEKRVSSKREGGEWGIQNLPSPFREVIQHCLNRYNGKTPKNPLDEKALQTFVSWIVREIHIQKG